MLPFFLKYAETHFQKTAKGWAYTPIGSKTAGHVADDAAFAQVRHAHASFVFLSAVELFACVILFAVATYVTMESGNPLEGIAPFQVIALAPVPAIGFFYLRYRKTIKTWVKAAPEAAPAVR